MNALVLAFALSHSSFGQEPEEQPRLWTLPHQAIVECGQHAAANPFDAPFLRYIIFPYADRDLYDWHVWVVNMVASDLRNSEVIFPVAVDPKGLWVAWDFRTLAPRIEKLEKGVKPLKLKIDVNRLLFAFDRIEDLTLQVQLAEPIIVEVAKAVDVDKFGNYVLELVKVKRRRVMDVQYQAAELLQATQTTTPVATLYEFHRQILSEDYYRFLTDAKTIDELLLDNGWDIARSAELLAVARALIAYSGITRGPRAVQFTPGLGNRVDVNNGLYMESQDFFREDVTFFNAQVDPFQNVLKGTSNFGEHFIQRANGGWAVALDQDRKLIDKVNADVAIDELTVHGPLTNGISCLGCHLQGQMRGVQPIRKDFAELLKNNLDIIVAIVSKARGVSLHQVRQELNALYRWDERFAKGDEFIDADFIAQARDDFSDFCVKCTGALEPEPRPGMQPEDLAEITRRFWQEYVIDPIGTKQAHVELNVELRENLQQRLAIAQPENAYAVLPAMGSRVGRTQWNEAKRLIYPRLLPPAKQPEPEPKKEETE